MEKIKNKIIFTADDFGISPTANRNIIQLIKLGKIDRVEIITSGVYSAKEAESLIRSKVMVGIHLNATENAFPRLSEERRIIRRLFKFIYCFLSGKSGARIVKVDWEKQIEKFHKDFNRWPDGISSHEHVHFLPTYFKLALCLANKYKIPYLRFGNKEIVKCRGLIPKVISFLHQKNRGLFLTSRLQSSEFLTSLDWIDSEDNWLEKLPMGEIEIACHPEREWEMKKVMELRK